MTVTIDKPMAAFGEEPHNYHIKIVGASRRTHAERYSRARIDTFLTDLFDKGSEELDSPLEFSRHDFNEDTSDTSSNVLLVELRLTGEAQASNITLDVAAERFCQLMFDPQARGILGALTPHGLLGVSAVSGSFKTYWTQTFFRDYMTHGPRLLRTIDTTFSNYLSEWALTLSFAVVAGLNFEVFASAAPRSFNFIELFGTIGVTLGSSILEKYTRRNEPAVAEPAVAELGSNWRHEHGELIRSIDTVSQRLEEATDPRTMGNNQLRQHNYLCDALYEATVVAAKTFTSNRNIFEAFVKLRKKAAFDATSGGLAAVAALTHLGSAFSFVTTTQALPLTSWCLADAAAFITGAGAPVVSTTTLCVAWPAAIAAVGISTFFGVKGYLNMQEYKKFQKQMEHHMQMNVIIARAWGLAHDTHTLLGWIHITDTFVPGLLEFVDESAQSNWARFIESVRATTGGNATRADLGPQMVLTYLSEQSRSLRNFRAALVLDA